MELKPGYKLTEVGVIPEDWDVLPLSKCCSKITDGTHDTPQPVRTGIPYLTAIHIKKNHIDFENCYFLPESVHAEIFIRCNPEKGDVLMVNIGAGVATTALVEVEYEFSLKNVALLKPYTQKLLGKYLNQSQLYRREVIARSLLSGGAQPFLSLGQIGQIKIALPPLPEQRAIATTLSDMDALLGALDRLIAKKRDLKQAAMQQLLTGKIRLPGFGKGKGYKKTEVGLIPEDWEVVPLGGFVKITSGASPSQFRFSGSGIPYFKVEQLSNTEKYLDVTDTPYLFERGDTVSGRSVIFAKRGAAIALNKLRMLNQEFFMDTNLMALTPQDGLHVEYLYYALSHIELWKFADTTSVPQINNKHVKPLPFPLPSLPEQTAIATILSDMDSEITAIEQRRDKTRSLKQAMMQELLTGKTRLITPGGCHD